jgi:heme exporter protein B
VPDSQIRGDAETANADSSAQPAAQPTKPGTPGNTSNASGGSGSATANFSGSLGVIWALARKDLLLEIRNRDIVISIVGFVLLVMVIFTFAVDIADRDNALLVGPGVLWAGIAFAGVIGLNRAFALEMERDTLEGLMLTPVSRDLIFLGKALGNFLFLGISSAIALLVFAVLFNLVVLRFEMLVIALLAVIGFSAVGTVFAAMSARVRAREIMLPLLFLPVVVPLLFAVIEATADLVAGDSWKEMSQWLQLAGAFDLVFVIVSAFIFQFILED